MQQAASVALSYTTALLDDYLARQKAVLERQGFEVETRIVPGFAKSEIKRIANTEDYGLIVVGSHGHSMAERGPAGRCGERNPAWRYPSRAACAP
ncbi:MAG: universal stress protein [Thermochromatium sp.]